MFPATAPLEKLNRQHPTHALYADAWDSFDLLNAGGVRLKQQAQRLLQKRPKELFDCYSERCKRFTYQNIMGQIVGWYAGALFRKQPSIDLTAGQDKAWYEEQFLVNCDRGGHSYVKFFQDLFRNLILYKYCFVLTDLPHAAVKPQDRAEEQAAGLDQPYLCCYEPRSVINWQADEWGQLTWAVVKTESQTGDFLGQGKKVTRWYYFDRTQYATYENVDKANASTEAASATLFDPSGNRLDIQGGFARLVDQGTHALAKVGRVPLRVIEVDDELWLANRVFLQLCDHLNQDNSLGWALFQANLAMPAIFSDDEVGPQTMSEVGYLKFKQGDKFEWTEPAGNSFKHSQERLDSLREEIYRTVYLQAQGRDSSAAATGASGYSKELDMMPANDVLNSLGDVLIPAMQDVFKDVVAARGQDEETVKIDVTGFRFETKPLTVTIALHQEMTDAGVYQSSETLERVMLHRIASDAVEDQNEDTKQKIKKEIDAAPMTVARQEQQQQQQMEGFQQTFQKLSDRQTVKDEGAALAA